MRYCIPLTSKTAIRAGDVEAVIGNLNERVWGQQLACTVTGRGVTVRFDGNVHYGMTLQYHTRHLWNLVTYPRVTRWTEWFRYRLTLEIALALDADVAGDTVSQTTLLQFGDYRGYVTYRSYEWSWGFEDAPPAWQGLPKEIWAIKDDDAFAAARSAYASAV